MRDGLKQLIELSGPYEIIGQYNDGKALIEDLPLSTSPDLIIMDLTMPIMNGEDTARYLHETGLQYPILILTVNATDDVIVKLYKLGVRGYLEKHCATVNLLRAIEDILCYGYHHNELLTKAFVTEVRSQSKNPREQILKSITPRELFFLQLVCDDNEYTYDQIASKMSVAVRTVDGYRQSIFEKFDIKSKAGLVLFAIKNRLTEI